MNRSLATFDPWHALSRFTGARIGLGRAGASLPTRALLDFGMDHALARDAIDTPLDTGKLAREFEESGFHIRQAWSRAKDRAEYLHRPDLGKRLDVACINELRTEHKGGRLTLVVADGLSSLAPALHALPLLRELRPKLDAWALDEIVIASQARVALGDEIGSLRGAEAIVMLIGERPGLNAADSLGAYLTYKPFVGRTDAERNCVSNIRSAGLSYEEAAYKLAYLLREARLLGSSGVSLKDESDGEGREVYERSSGLGRERTFPIRSPKNGAFP